MNREKLYWEADSWVSHLSFYKDELKFLQKLLDRYFEDMVQYQNLDEIREEVMRFQDLKFASNKLLISTREHRHLLALAIDKQDAEQDLVQQKHLALREEFQNFELGFSTVKREIQEITKELLEIIRQ